MTELDDPTGPIVIYRLGSLGDTVVALPCFNRIMASYPRSQRLVLTNVPVSRKAAPLEAILGTDTLIHGSITYPVRTRDPRAILEIRQALRDLGSDTLIYLNGDRGRARTLRDVLLFRSCGFKRIVGAPLSRDLQHPRKDSRGLEEPEAERLARCLAALGPIDLSDRAAWDLHLSAGELAEGESFLRFLEGRPFLSVNTGGKVLAKDWGEDKWTALLQRLGAGSNLALVFLGGAEDWERAQRLALAWPGPVLNGCGELSPRQTASVVIHSKAFVGHDSGPLHLAAAMGVRCVGIFGEYNRPRRWHPYGEGHRVIHNLGGVGLITPAEVEVATRETLAPCG